MSELQEPVTVVVEGAQFALLSSANGAVYVLRSKEDQSSTWFEGDDARAFLTEYETIKTKYPGYDADQLLAQLWDQGGYS
jgi:hypothetical protein